jgi:hypothetical protein
MKFLHCRIEFPSTLSLCYNQVALVDGSVFIDGHSNQALFRKSLFFLYRPDPKGFYPGTWNIIELKLFGSLSDTTT